MVSINTHGRLGVDMSAPDDFGSLQGPIFTGPSPERHDARHLYIGYKFSNQYIVFSECCSVYITMFTLLGNVDFLATVSCLVYVPDAEIRKSFGCLLNLLARRDFLLIRRAASIRSCVCQQKNKQLQSQFYLQTQQ